ncbi:hypothetical protein SprV_0802622600 [Sparganum proliferum]
MWEGGSGRGPSVRDDGRQPGPPPHSEMLVFVKNIATSDAYDMLLAYTRRRVIGLRTTTKTQNPPTLSTAAITVCRISKNEQSSSNPEASAAPLNKVDGVFRVAVAKLKSMNTVPCERPSKLQQPPGIQFHRSIFGSHGRS